MMMLLSSKSLTIRNIAVLNYAAYANFSQSTNTICVIAGGPHEDARGAQLIRSIKKQSPLSRFIGLGGPLMQQAGLEDSYANINKFCHKPLFPYRNFLRFHIERTYHPVMAWYHWKNRSVLKDLDNSNFFNEVLATRPSAFFVLGNEFFMRRLFTLVGDVYYNHDLLKPPTFHLGRSHSMLRHEFKDYLDHHFSVIPRPAVNYQYFQFPNTVVGSEGIGRAWQYLYQASPKFKSFAGENHIFLSQEFNKDIIESLVAEERQRFRRKNNITETRTVILLAPGNIPSEVDWSLAVVQKGVQEFFRRKEVKGLDKTNFHLLVLSPEEGDKIQTAFIKEKISTAVQKMNWDCTVQVTTDKYSAMCGADFGIAHNGEIVSEAAACQLPLTIIDSLPLLQAYHTQLYNEWNNDLNIAVKGEVYQELLSVSATPYKIAQEFSKFFLDPKIRYFYANRYSEVLFQMVPQLNQEGEGSQQLIDQKFAATKHGFTFETIANKVVLAAKAYSAEDKNMPGYKVEGFRPEFLKKVGLQ